MKKEIKDFPEYYIYDDGRLWSEKRHRFLKPQKIGNGYLAVQLSNHGQITYKLIHRLVAEAFIPNPDKLPEVNHKDENLLNNCVDNLEWCTKSYNINYGTRNSRSAMAQPNRKKCIQYDKNNNFIREFESISDAARMLGDLEYKKNICACMKGKKKTAYGFIWKYAEDDPGAES